MNDIDRAMAWADKWVHPYPKILARAIRTMLSRAETDAAAWKRDQALWEKDRKDLALCLSEGCDAYEISEIARLAKEVEVWSRKYADLEAEYYRLQGYAPLGAESAGYKQSPKAGLEAKDAQAPGDGRDKAGPASPEATRAAFDEARQNLFHEREPKQWKNYMDGW